MKNKLFFILMLLIAFAPLLLLMTGCTAVKSYEREYLADRIMNFDANKEETLMEQHFLLTREGSMGGLGGAGGGCACN